MTSDDGGGGGEITNDEILTLLRDLIRHCDAEVLRRLGRPLYLGLLVFPSVATELVSWASNSDPAERGKLAAAMKELLTRWGYMVLACAIGGALACELLCDLHCMLA